MIKNMIMTIKIDENTIYTQGVGYFQPRTLKESTFFEKYPSNSKFDPRSTKIPPKAGFGPLFVSFSACTFWDHFRKKVLSATRSSQSR